MSGSEGWITAARATLEGEEVPPGESFGRAMREWEDDVLIIAYRALDALDAVLALHHPEPAGWGVNRQVCAICIEECGDHLYPTEYEPWPCATVRAIEGDEDGTS